MQLEDYFDVLTPNDIRVKGTRVGIEKPSCSITWIWVSFPRTLLFAILP
jgi:hypothetical protein